MRRRAFLAFSGAGFWPAAAFSAQGGQENGKMAKALLKTPFRFASTADEVLAGVDLRGKRCLVTGGASGIGAETMRALARAGAHVTVAARRSEAAGAAIEKMRQELPGAAIDVVPLDVSNLDSVRALCAAWSGPLHILVNNAGVMAIPEHTLSAQGFEMQFATNYLGHFALTLGLRAHMEAAGGARVVNVSSSGHLFSPVNFDDLHYRFIPYTPIGAYGQSKTACVLMSVGIARRWAEKRICSNALNPGAIATQLQKHTGGLKTPPHLRKTPQQGAATTALLAASPLLDGVSGKYFEDCNESAVVSRRPTDFSGGVAPFALSGENADRLWDAALEMLAQAGWTM